MRYFALFLMILSLCVFSVGCPAPEDPAPPPEPAPVDQPDDPDDPVIEEENDDEPAAPVEDDFDF